MVAGPQVTRFRGTLPSRGDVGAETTCQITVAERPQECMRAARQGPIAGSVQSAYGRKYDAVATHAAIGCVSQTVLVHSGGFAMNNVLNVATSPPHTDGTGPLRRVRDE